MKPDDIRKELSEIAPELSKLPVQKNRSIPEGYFETLPDATWNKIEHNNTKHITLPKISYRLISGIAASLLVLIGSVYQLNQQPQVNEEILVEDMVEYMLDDVDQVDTEQLFDLYVATEDIPDKEIEEFDYLEEDGINDIDEHFLETLY